MGQQDAERESLELWRAHPTVRTFVLGLLGGPALFGVSILVFHLLAVVSSRPFNWTYSWGSLLIPVVFWVASFAASTRGRVVLHADGIEVRRLRLRRYPWSSLKSITMDESGRIEITPKGWVRFLPIPRDQADAAFRTIKTWQRRHAC